MKKVLIVVDMQKGFLKDDSYKPVLKKVNELLSDNDYTDIIFTKFINLKNSLYETKIGWTGLQDELSQEFAIDIPSGSKIFEKFGYGLSQNQLDYIKSLNVDNVSLCGVQTDACVYAISFQLFDMGIFPNVLINYCSTSPSRQTSAKEMLIHQFGSVDEIE